MRKGGLRGGESNNVTGGRVLMTTGRVIDHLELRSPVFKQRGGGRWRKMTLTLHPTTSRLASEDCERSRNEELNEEEMEEKKRRNKDGG